MVKIAFRVTCYRCRKELTANLWRGEPCEDDLRVEPCMCEATKLVELEIAELKNTIAENNRTEPD